MVIYLGCTSPCSSCSLPGIPSPSLGLEDEQSHIPAWPCSLWGLPGRPHCCERRWSLTPPFHPYRKPAVCLCGPVRQVAPPRELPGKVLYGVRTFLDSGKQSRDHSANLWQYDHTQITKSSQQNRTDWISGGRTRFTFPLLLTQLDFPNTALG
jgi:hypothetical protein